MLFSLILTLTAGPATCVTGTVVAPQENTVVRQATVPEAATAPAPPHFNPKTGKWPKPTVLYPVTRVIDGDTIWIERNGERAKLRLLSVDTEEQIIGSKNATELKPETVFGEECARWAEEFFANSAEEGQQPMVALAFPPGMERNDIYGRLLCQVVLPDGTDYNLMLVRLGKSPYFNKYGNSRLMHEAFVAAQAQARKAHLGIWNPATNRPTDPSAPSARRPYEKLLPWWQARADAIDRFRKRNEGSPEHWLEAEDSSAVRLAFEAGNEVELFGGVNRVFDEDDGSLTVLFRAGDKNAAVRASISKQAKSAFLEAFDLYGINDPFRQNYVYLKGRLTEGPRGFRMDGNDAANWRIADPAYDARE